MPEHLTVEIVDTPSDPVIRIWDDDELCTFIDIRPDEIHRLQQQLAQASCEFRKRGVLA